MLHNAVRNSTNQKSVRLIDVHVRLSVCIRSVSSSGFLKFSKHEKISQIVSIKFQSTHKLLSEKLWSCCITGMNNVSLPTLFTVVNNMKETIL